MNYNFSIEEKQYILMALSTRMMWINEYVLPGVERAEDDEMNKYLINEVAYLQKLHDKIRYGSETN